jgi:hypothetical protein
MHRAHLPFPSLLIAVAASLLAPGCTPPDNERSAERSPAADQPARVPTPLPIPEAPLDRRGLIIAALSAATAAALKEDDSVAQAELKGKRFQIRIRFGCSADDIKTGSGWTHDAAKGVLRARVRSDLDGKLLKAGGLADGTYEGAVGFTLRRPWMLADGCPEPGFVAMSEGPTIAIAQLFTSSDSRVQRPENSYEAVSPIVVDQLPAQGLSLVVSGRLKPLPDERAIRCAAVDGPPVCIISSVIDRVAIEDPVRKVTLAEWGGS